MVTLRDDDVTRRAVIDGFRGHLGQATQGDTALFWFSGHGSLAPVPPGMERLEPTGKLQTMLCADSRHDGVPDLLDKELGVLIGEVSARGVHVAVVLDCCHADGASREVPSDDAVAPGLPSLRARWAPVLTTPPPIEALLAELTAMRDAGPDQGPSATRSSGADHVALAACHSNQVAYEVPWRDGHRGLFGLALLSQLERLGPEATYRELMIGARCFVENVSPRQRPVLFPVAEDIVDQPFLGGRLRSPNATMTMRFVRDAWEIDAGACHGLVSGTKEEPTRVGVYGSDGKQEARVVRVLPYHSAVEPVGWAVEPDRGAQYPVVVTRVPLPATTVAVDGPLGEPAAAMLAEAVHTVAPGGSPSPYIRMVELADPDRIPEIRVAIRKPDTVRILGSDGSALVPDVPHVSDRDAALRVVADLEHIARWRQIKALGNPRSALAGAIRLELVAARPGELAAPDDRPPLRVDDAGAVVLEYQASADGWTPPDVFVRLHNTTDRELYCVLLDLTDRFRIHPGLFSGDWIAPRYTAWAGEGEPITFSLPPRREPVAGASGTDWLKVLVAEEPFNSTPFELSRLGEPQCTPGTRGAGAYSGVLEQLGLTAMFRDADAVRPQARDWTTSIMSVVTRVPDRIG
jgi:hypothetical protein